MRQQGKKSRTSEQVSGVIDMNWPPDPPANLNALAQDEWREIIKSLSADAIPKQCYPLLAVWCAVKVDLDAVMASLAALEPGLSADANFKFHKQLISMRSTLSQQLANISVKLRLTPQSRHEPSCHATVRDVSKPWNEKESRGKIDSPRQNGQTG